MSDTINQALIILESWHSTSRLTKMAYRQMSEIAQACAEELGEDLPDNAMSHSMLTAWLKKQPNVFASGVLTSIPENAVYLGLPE